MPTKREIIDQERHRRIEYEQAGEAVRLARKLQKDTGGRPADEIKRLREMAAKTAALCADCFEPLSPDASVTPVCRYVEHLTAWTNAIGYRIAARDRYLTVPICLSCWLDDIASRDSFVLRGVRQNGPIDRAEPGTQLSTFRRLRCQGCERPMRVERPPSWSSRVPLPERCCCIACLHKAKLRRANDRRRVHHQEIACEACGEMFIPKQSTAKTCSNACRQRLLRQRRARH